MKALLKTSLRFAPLQWAVAAVIAAYMALVWCSSRKLRLGPPPPKGQKILALWHGRLMLSSFLDPSARPLATFSSASRDGLVITKAARLHGVRAIYGSSREGAVSGFRQALRQAQQGVSLLFTPDGPTGPRMVAQEGVVECARLTGLPVVPMSFSATRTWQFKSWDRLLLPQPFGTLVLAYGQPLRLAKNSDTPTKKAFLALLTDRLSAVQDGADRIAGRPTVPGASAEEISRWLVKQSYKTPRRRGG